MSGRRISPGIMFAVTIKPTPIIKMLAFLAVLALAPHQVSAFPALLSEALIHARAAEPDLTLIDSTCPHMAELMKRQAPGGTPPFNAAEQYVSNAGSHAFVASGPNDQRGPCPALNAMANHGTYLTMVSVAFKISPLEHRLPSAWVE